MSDIIDIVTTEVVIDIVASEEAAAIDLVTETIDIIETLPAGPAGPVGATGATGPQGPQGPAGVSGGSYTHTQNSTSTTWVVQHNLGYFPAITVVDSAGTTVIGEVTHDSANQATVRFASAFSGKAYAS